MAQPPDRPVLAAPARVDAASLQQQLRRRLNSSEPAAWLHQEVARRMAERLGVIKAQPQTVIDWWATLGGSDRVLREHCPRAQRVPVEPAGLLHLAPGAAPASWWRRLRASPPPAAAVLPDDARFDAPMAQLLWANMMLHWVDDLPMLFSRWQAAVTSEGFLMFSCFGPDTLRELRPLYAQAGWGLPASPFIDMHDIGDALVHAGFADPVMDMEMLTLSWASADDLLAELRTLGGNTATARPPGLRTPRWRQRLAASLTERLGDAGGRLHLSFEIVYGHAFRPVPRARLAPHTEISLDSMRDMVRRRGPTSTNPAV